MFPYKKSCVKAVLLRNKSSMAHCLFKSPFYHVFCGVFLPQTEYCIQMKKKIIQTCFLLLHITKRGMKTCMHMEFLSKTLFASELNFTCFEKGLSTVLLTTTECGTAPRGWQRLDEMQPGIIHCIYTPLLPAGTKLLL